MAASATVAVARLGGRAHRGRAGDDALREADRWRIGCRRGRRQQGWRIPGCTSPSVAILVADDGERLVCAFNDAKLVPDCASLPLDRIGSFDAVLADVRWPQGAATVCAAPARRPARVLDGDVGPREVLIDLAERATHALFPGMARSCWHSERGSQSMEGRVFPTRRPRSNVRGVGRRSASTAPKSRYYVNMYTNQ